MTTVLIFVVIIAAVIVAAVYRDKRRGNDSDDDNDDFDDEIVPPFPPDPDGYENVAGHDKDEFIEDIKSKTENLDKQVKKPRKRSPKTQAL